MGVLWNDISSNSSGGTELMCRRLEAGLPQELLDDVQIVPSRLYGELDATKIRILYLHDLPGDPESTKILKDGGWRQFHKIVCVSNWQMQGYINVYQIPWSKFVVIPNSIEPITPNRPNDGITRFIYHTTPHRGLELLYAVFDKLREKYPNIHLDVYSSFGIYGWEARDQQYSSLFERIEQNPGMTYHKHVSNEEIRDALAKADIFAYPSIWPETSCLALIEAMSAGLFCCHSNYGALAETGANWTAMYQFSEIQDNHAGIMYQVLDRYLADPSMQEIQLKNQKAYADIFYNWNSRKNQWIEMIVALQKQPREFEKEMFRYSA